MDSAPTSSQSAGQRPAAVAAAVRGVVCCMKSRSWTLGPLGAVPFVTEWQAGGRGAFKIYQDADPTQRSSTAEAVLACLPTCLLGGQSGDRLLDYDDVSRRLTRWTDEDVHPGRARRDGFGSQGCLLSVISHKPHSSSSSPVKMTGFVASRRIGWSVGS